MAIDTRDKRTSVLDVLMPYRTAEPLADGSVDDDDRLTVGWLYSGITLQATAPVVDKSLIIGVVRGVISKSPTGVISQVDTFLAELFDIRRK